MAISKAPKDKFSKSFFAVDLCNQFLPKEDQVEFLMYDFI